jgi:chemotaxis signal transduction protein
MANANWFQPPAAERPAYVAGTITVGEQLLEVLDLEAFIASNSTRDDDSQAAQVQS